MAGESPIMIAPWATALMALTCFGCFAWAVKGHFLASRGTPRPMQILSVASLGGMLWFLFRVGQYRLTVWWPVGIAAMAMALGLFWWTIATTRSRRLSLAFDDEKPKFLQQAGPYRWIRHPFYTSYILFWIATSVATAGIVHWIVPVTFIAAYVSAARMEERKFATSSLGPVYQIYRQATGMMFPIIWKRSA